MLSHYFIFIFGAEILFLAHSATFSREPELMHKTLPKESHVIKKIQKAASCAQGKIYALGYDISDSDMGHFWLFYATIIPLSFSSRKKTNTGSIIFLCCVLVFGSCVV